MKKLLISLTILFSLFFGLNSVSAEELNTSNLFNYVHFTNLYGLTDDEMLSLGNSVNVDLTDFVKNYNIHKQKATLKNFVFRYENGMGVTIFYKSNDTWTLNLKDNSTYYVVYVEDRNTTSKVSVKYNTWSSTTLYSPSQSAYSLGQINNIKKDVAKEYYFFYISDLENDLYLKYTTSLNGSGYLTSDIIIDSNIYSINEITPINLKTGYHSLKEDKPKINILSTQKNELGEIIKINFSEFDKEKFIYLYNFNNQPGNENWHEITENDYEYSSILNGTLYVKAIDREQFLLNGDTTPVVSATYTFTNLLMYEDIIDTYNMSDYAEIEYRYYGNNPAMFYYTTYRYGQVPENTYCITGTGIYECNILSIKEITSNFYYYATIEKEESKYLYQRILAYEDNPTYSIKKYDHAIIEDLSKYPVNSNFFYNNYRSFTLDLSMYIKEENRSRYIYVYYSTDIYDKTIKTSQSSWDSNTNTNNKLDDLTEETSKPPTYQENIENKDNYFLGFFKDLINKKFPIINQFTFIISTFSFKENDDIPNLTVDLSSMGIPGKVTIIDIETYKQCREMLFFFEYFGICMIGIPKIINNIKSSLGGDK